MNRPRAADDFDVIRERLEELRRERAETTEGSTAEDRATEGGDAEAERPSSQGSGAAPAAWQASIFLPQPTD